MSEVSIKRLSGWLASALAVCVSTTAFGATTLRVVSYNISGDTTTFDTGGINNATAVAAFKR